MHSRWSGNVTANAADRCVAHVSIFDLKWFVSCSCLNMSVFDGRYIFIRQMMGCNFSVVLNKCTIWVISCTFNIYLCSNSTPPPLVSVTFLVTLSGPRLWKTLPDDMVQTIVILLIVFSHSSVFYYPESWVVTFKDPAQSNLPFAVT